jgi:hypothetical protein
VTARDPTTGTRRRLHSICWLFCIVLYRSSVTTLLAVVLLVTPVSASSKAYQSLACQVLPLLQLCWYVGCIRLLMQCTEATILPEAAARKRGQRDPYYGRVCYPASTPPRLTVWLLLAPRTEPVSTRAKGAAEPGSTET